MEQVEAFLGAAERNRKADIVADAVVMRNATQAGKKDFTEFMKSLSSTAPTVEPVVKVTRADVGRLKALFEQKR